MKIAVCESESTRTNVLISQIQPLSLYDELTIFENGKEMINSKAKFDLIFYRLGNSEINNFGIAESFRKNNPDSFIVLISNSIRYISEAFKIGVFRFLVEPFDPKEIFEAFFSSKQEFCKQKSIHIKQRGNALNIQIKDIVCFEALGDGTCIYSKNSYIISSHSLKYWKEQIDGTIFLQVHRSYLVSLNSIQSIENNSLIMKNLDFRIPVSRRCRSGLNRCFNSLHDL